MKKGDIWILWVAMSLLFPTMVGGEIKKTHDGFKNTTRIESFRGGVKVSEEEKRELVPFDLGVGLAKVTDAKNEILVGLSLFHVSGKWWFFAKMPIEMKIGDDIYELPNLTTDGELISAYSLMTDGVWTIPEKMREKIRQADSIILRVYYTNQPATTWNVPLDVLAEWKQVLSDK